MMKTLHPFPYKHVLVLGLARSGTAAAKLLINNGVKTRANDYQVRENDPEIEALESLGIEIITGSHPLSVLTDIDLIVKNPGISYHNPLLKEAERREIPIVTEIELAGIIAKAHDMIAITGSNGKTTTTTLVDKMLQKGGVPSVLAGNIGVVATDVAQQLQQDEKLVLELSSFQLMGIQTFRPRIAVLLNIFEAHLDYHGSLKNYIQAKANVFRNQQADDFLIYNADDELVSSLVRSAKSTLIPFSTKSTQSDGAWMDGEALYFMDQRIISKKDIALVGEHNMQNILAAISVARLSGATKQGIQEVLSSFTGVEHRLQFVKRLHDRVFYNDSKATNMLATQKALEAFNQPTVLLAGGLDRGDTYDRLLPYLQHVKGMVVFGETKTKLKKLAEQAKINAIFAEDVQEATKLAYGMSDPGDVILLSPACASWDQYKTFEERGNMFVQTVHILA